MNCSYVGDAPEDETPHEMTHETETHGGLEWHTNYAAAHALAKREGRMLLVDFVPKAESSEQRQLDDAIEKDAVAAKTTAVDGVGAVAARLRIG